MLVACQAAGQSGRSIYMKLPDASQALHHNFMPATAASMQMWAFDTDVFKDALLPVLHACVTEANQLWENFDATLNQQLWPSPPTESASAQVG